MKWSQRGGFVLGMVVGLLLGLALALGVALYITKAPVPFINKVPQRTAAQDNAEVEHNRNWDPNAPLAGKSVARPASGAGTAASAVAAGTPAPAPVSPPETAPVTAPTTAPAPVASPPPSPSRRDPAAILSGTSPAASGPAAFVYYVQVGAYMRPEEAEQQRAKLGLIGYAAKVTAREQAGRTVLRVRVGPYDSRDEAEGVQTRLTDSQIEARLVRVERE